MPEKQIELSQTRADLGVIAAQLDQPQPPRKTMLFVERASLMNIPQGRTAILAVGSIVLIAVSLVILIACANVANLLMARAVLRSFSRQSPLYPATYPRGAPRQSIQ